ncbi:MAG: hypothetical protein CMN56_05170 [Sneathiella sp.]|uniref:winged helix domain-containing protein n=1 Tax=Sneathiella sp. TaxID=1964365 RepID=UPI000C62575F|nr:hypothetical protein [Sneathiella sp.]MAZ02510.1 hypothetical protein [Sneathiella sp.]
MSRMSVTAINKEYDAPTPFTVRGQTAKCLLALVEAGEKGTTALETSSWALRFSAYCFDLRHNHGLSIRTDREPHDAGWHGRHVLETPVEIIEIKRPEGGANG